MAGLTARFVAGVKGEAGRRVEHLDDAIKGLALRVTEAGEKSWTLRYRTPAREQRRLTLGSYPALGLKEARDEAIKALGAVATGRDVGQEKQTHRRRARLSRTEKPQTLAALWGIYDRDVMPRKRERTARFQRWLWEKHVRPRLGDNALATLDRATIRSALKGIGEEAPITANRALALIRHMLNMAVAEEYIAATPLARMGALYDEVSRDRVLSDDELVRFWKAMEVAPARADMPVSARMVAALKLVLLTVARPGDVAGLDASEIDAAARSWTIPAGRFKGKRAHTVPLSTDAWALLREAYGAPHDQWRGPAFPNARDNSRPMERTSLTRAMQRIVTDAQIPRATPHDLRRTGATYLASERVGVAPHIVTAILGHAAEGPAVSAVYIRHRYDKEKRTALQAWAALLREIVSGRARNSNVTPISRAKRKTEARP